MMLKAKYLIIIMALSVAKIFCQNTVIDSLKAVLIKSAEDTNKVKTLNELGWQLSYNGRYSEALPVIIQAKELAEKYHFIRGEGRAYTNIGNFYSDQGNYPEALKNYFIALKKREETGNQQDIAGAYNNIAIVYEKQNDHNEALAYHLRSLKIREAIGDKQDLAASYYNIGLILSRQRKYDEALKNHRACLALSKEIGFQYGIASAYNGLGTVYYYQKKYPEALENHMAALDEEEKINDTWGVAGSYVNIAFAYLYLKNHNQANKYCLKAIKLADELSSLDIKKEAYQCLSDLYGAKGDHKNSFEFFKKYIAARDSLVNEENTKKTVQTQMQYEFDKKESAAKAEQEKKDAITATNSRKQRIILFSISVFGILVLLLAMVIFRSLRINQRKNKIITEQKELVERQKLIVEEKQKEILDSIHYAKRIQTALLPSEKYVGRHIKRL